MSDNQDGESRHLGKNRLLEANDDGQAELQEPDTDAGSGGGSSSGGGVGGGSGSGSGGGELAPLVAEAARALAAARAAAGGMPPPPAPGGSSAAGNPPLPSAPASSSFSHGSAPVTAGDTAALAYDLAGLSVSGAGDGSSSAQPAPSFAATDASAAGAAGSFPSSSAPGASSASSEQMASLQQDYVNMVALVASLQSQVQNLAGSPSVQPAVGPVLAPGVASPAGGSPASHVESERRAAKAEFESSSAAWRAGRLMWAYRGQRGTDNQRDLMATIVAGHIAFNDKVFTQLKSMAGFNVLDFCPVGRPSDLSITDHFDLMCESIMMVLKFGLQAGVQADAESLARLQPLEAAMLKARASFRMQLLSHHGDFEDAASREVLADIPNADMRVFSNQLAAWMLPMCRLSTAPASFEAFGPPPVPEYNGIKQFATSGSHLIRMFANANRGGQRYKKRRADSSESGGGGSSGGGGDKRPKKGICFNFRDKGVCKFGQACKFNHPRGSAAQGADGSDGSNAASGSGSTGGGGRGGGSSAALVVRGGSSASNP